MRVGVRLAILGVLVALGVTVAHAAFGVSAAAPGQWIVFSASPKGLPPAQLFRIQTNGAGLQQITTGPKFSTDPSFSPDGKRIVFVRLGDGIFVVNLDGTGLRRLTRGRQDHFPVWSPNGKQIAFLRVVKKSWRLHVMKPSGAGLHVLKLAPPAGRPTWTANSKSIWIPVLGALDRVDARTGRPQRKIPISIDPSTGQSATVSPNSRYVMFVGPRPSAEGCGDSSCIRFALFLGTVSNHKVRRFALDTGPAGWTPDGKRVVFVFQNGLHVWPLAGGKKAVIATGDAVAAGDAPPAWQPA